MRRLFLAAALTILSCAHASADADILVRAGSTKVLEIPRAAVRIEVEEPQIATAVWLQGRSQLLLSGHINGNTRVRLYRQDGMLLAVASVQVAEVATGPLPGPGMTRIRQDFNLPYLHTR